MNMRREIDLSIILIWSLAIIPFIVVPTIENNILRSVIGIPIVLFIPGYLLTVALFPKKSDIGMTGKIALGLGLSIVVISFLGLLLNFTFGLKFFHMITILYIYTIIMVIYIAYKREKLPEDERFCISFHKMIGNITPKNSMDGILTGILILTIILSIGMAYMAITFPKIGDEFTEFYILDSSGKVTNYSTNLNTDNVATYKLGVVNHEYDTTNYRIDAVVGQDILTSRYLILNNDEVWEDNVVFTLDKKDTDVKLEFLLFKNDLKEPYRKLYLRVNVG